ncbi:MAG: YdcF family protein [Alphaproteobacteria bacterium]|nr:YdcF family protein [Alphaproteobacteria bacterium]
MTVGGLLRYLAVALATIVLIWLGGFLWFARSLADQTVDATTATDAVIVLTGGSERLDTGFALLAEGRMKKLFITGVGRSTKREEIRGRAAAVAQLFDCCVVIGREARDTAGNAIEAATWMESEGYRSLRLVTGNYHMPRSLIEFRRIMPDVTIVPHPVFPARVMTREWWGWPGTAGLIASEYTKYLFALAQYRLAPPRPRGTT